MVYRRGENVDMLGVSEVNVAVFVLEGALRVCIEPLCGPVRA